MKSASVAFLGLSFVMTACSTEPAESQPTPHAEDFAALAACEETRACEVATAQRIESDEPFASYGMRCVLDALRTRTPGVYEVEVEHAYSDGTTRKHHTYVVTASGEIETGVSITVEQDDASSETTYLPTERCAPKPVAFFESCLTELGDTEGKELSDGAWACIFPSVDDDPPWLEGCADEAPACE